MKKLLLSLMLISAPLSASDDVLDDPGRWVQVPIQIKLDPDSYVNIIQFCERGYNKAVIQMVNVKSGRLKNATLNLFEMDLYKKLPVRRDLC